MGKQRGQRSADKAPRKKRTDAPNPKRSDDQKSRRVVAQQYPQEIAILAAAGMKPTELLRWGMANHPATKEAYRAYAEK